MLGRMSKEELERLIEKINQQREEKARGLSDLKQCKGCKKEKPTREFLSLRRHGAIIQTCQNCQRPLNAINKDPDVPEFLAGKRKRTESEKVRESNSLELERNRMLASKRAKQTENSERKGDAEVAMQTLNSKLKRLRK